MPSMVGLQHALVDDDELGSMVVRREMVDHPLTKESAAAYYDRYPPMVHLSCFHGDQEKWAQFKSAKWGAATDEPIKELYLQAISRLPIHQMPTLFEALYRGGHCLGLLDPTSNIILNGVSFMARLQSGICSSLEGTSRLMPPDPCHRGAWSLIAHRSYNGMIAFLQSFFPQLSEELARLFIYISAGDLVVATRLVELELSAAIQKHQEHRRVIGCHPDAFAERAQFALRIAALKAKHPMPSDVLLLYRSCMSIEEMRPMLRTLEEGRPLTVTDIETIVKILQLQHQRASAMLNVSFPQSESGGRCLYSFDAKGGGGHFTARLVLQHRKMFCLTELRTSEGIRRKLRSCLATVPGYVQGLPRNVSYTPEKCKYIEHLKVGILDTMHSFYIEALSKLTYCGRKQLLQGIMLAGHCYGPLDPVANIILHAAWFNVMLNGPWQYSTNIVPDIIRGSALLRLEVRSLDGLVAAVCTITGYSEHEAVQYICTNRCRVPLLVKNSSVFESASEAAKHPLKKFHSRFLSSVTFGDQNVLSILQRQLCHRREFSDDTLKGLQHILELMEVKCPSNLRIESSSAEHDYMEELKWIAARRGQMRIFLRKEVGELLSRYADQHPWEPRYILETICGMEKHDGFLSASCYHINFIANASDGSSSPARVLFFAQLWQDKDFATEECFSFGVRYTEIEVSFCCPLPHYSSNNTYPGRCSICKPRMHVIVHPPSGMHVGAAESMNLYPRAEELASYADAVDSEAKYCDNTADFFLGKVVERCCS